MRLGTRLILALGATLTTVMALYGWVAFQQRAALLREGLIRETETLGRTMQIVADNALRDERWGDLERVLARVGDDPETVLAAIVDSAGAVIAGAPSAALTCFASADVPGPEMAAQSRGWMPCRGEAFRWVALPLREPGTRVLLGRRETVVRTDMARSRVRILLTTIILSAAAAMVILVVLRRTLTAPLTRIMEGVRSVGGPALPTPVHVPRSAGELRDLAEAFNEMAERLKGKRAALVREVDERVALEGRLRRAEKFAALGRLSGGLAHELGSPLNVMGIRGEAIEEHPNAPDDVRAHARDIIAQVDRVGDLVRSLQHVARGHPLDARPVDVVSVATAVLAEARAELEHHRIALEVELPDDPVPVMGDATFLRHAMMNLVRNAVQALQEHPGRRRLRVSVVRTEGVVEIGVEDSGPGIDRDHVPMLFEPFFTTREVGSGMGLGLAISQGIAEEHGGSLRLEAGDPGGLRAVLTLPLTDRPGDGGRP
jgi:signal transduction histidine kinase